MRISIYNFNGILDTLEAEVKRRGDYVPYWQDGEVLVVWQDAVGALSNMCRDTKQMGKKVIVAEHGLLSINDYIPPLSKPLIGDVFMAWGQVTKDWLIKKAGFPEERIVITGSTVFDRMGPKTPHEGKTVLFAPRHWAYEIDENLEVAETLKTYNKALVYSKIVVGNHDPDIYPNPILSERAVGNHLDQCYSALRTADVVVGVGEGTFAALAYYMDIPYISVDNWKTKPMLGKDYTREEFNSQISYACKRVNIANLLNEIDYQLANPDDMKEYRKLFVKEYLNGGNPKRALENQLKVIYGNS